MSTVSKKIAFFTLPSDEQIPFQPEMGEDPGLSGVLAQIPGILWTTDTDLRFTMTVGAGLAQLGLQRHELVGQTLYEFFKTSDPAFSPVAAHHAALLGLAHDFDFTAGDAVYHGCAEPLFDDDGRLLGTVATVMDASNRRCEEERRLRALLKAQAAKKAESLHVVARGVAHTFNNLLTAVIGYASLALKDLPADSPVLAYLQGIENSARMAADVAGQLGTYCGATVLAEEPLNLSALIESMGNLIQTTLPSRIEVTYDLDADLPFIYGDAGRLQRLLMALLTNAAEALGDETGVIHLRTQAVTADRNFVVNIFGNEDVPDGDYVWLQISDTGCGMDKETRRRIFEPFFSTKFIGRGLGMAMVQGITRAHHGAISVSSKPELGTTVHILLPVSGQGALPLTGPHKSGAAFQDSEQPTDCPAVYYY
jgi:two-component system cell cycle sensor histidine kinase/response regulator CckA